MEEEKIYHAGWVSTADLLSPGDTPVKRIWDGRTVVTWHRDKGLGVYCVRSQWCPWSIKSRARKMILEQVPWWKWLFVWCWLRVPS